MSYLKNHLSHDDIIYAVILLFGIAFGQFYRKIHEIILKKIVGTFLGCFIILYTSEINSIHIFGSFIISYGFIKFDER